MLQPLGKNIILRGLQRVKEQNGIILPNDSKMPDQYKVLAVGYGVLAVNEGDMVMLIHCYPQNIIVDNEELYVCKEEDILGILTQK